MMFWLNIVVSKIGLILSIKILIGKRNFKLDQLIYHFESKLNTKLKDREQKTGRKIGMIFFGWYVI